MYCIFKMKKSLFIIISTFISCICFGQITPDFIIERYHLWAKTQPLALEVSNKTAYQQLLLRNFIEKPESQFCYPVLDEFNTVDEWQMAWQKVYDKFHLVDLDNDGDFDLIFSGKLCDEHDQDYLMIFMCEYKASYKLTLFTEGKPLILNEKNEFVCFAPAHHLSLENTVKVFQFTNDRVVEKFQVKLFDSPVLRKSKKQARVFKNIIPKALDGSQECELPPGTVTYLTPNDTIPETDLIEKSTLHRLKKAQKVTIYNTLMDKQHQKWMYVSYREEQNPNSIVLGWVKTSNCH